MEKLVRNKLTGSGYLVSLCALAHERLVLILNFPDPKQGSEYETKALRTITLAHSPYAKEGAKKNARIVVLNAFSAQVEKPTFIMFFLSKSFF